jgi:TolB-like protein/Tfp pilus assembly protein PilF
MKRCPECRRDYFDDSLLYCLDDGSALLEGPTLSRAGVGVEAGPADEPVTAVISPHETEPATRTFERPPEDAPLPQSSAARTSNRNLIVAGAAGIVLVAALGIAGYIYYGRGATARIESIAVLPFENRSGNADSEYLSDGLAESLIYRLSQVPELKVSPRSSVFRYKGKAMDAEQVGTELGVDAVMSGRMVQRGDNLTISVDLVDVRNKKTIWGEQFERKMSDLLATQREIASAITEKLQLKLSGDAAKAVTKKYTDNNEAYQAYLKGRYYWNRRTAANLNKALAEFKTATEKDPGFALAFVGVADCYALMGEYAGAPTSDVIPQAKANAERALALDPQLGEVHATLALIADYSWQWAEAEKEYKLAIEANPNYPTTYHWYSIALKNLGRFDEADTVLKRAQQLDPVSSVISINVTRMLQLRKNDDAAIEHTLKLIELDPNFPAAYQYLALSQVRKGLTREAVASAEKGAEMGDRSGVSLADLGYVYALAGRKDDARAIIKELEAKYARREAKPLFIATVYAGLGEKEKMFEWLERGVEERSGQLAEIRWQMPFEPFHDEPQFKTLLKRMNLPE